MKYLKKYDTESAFDAEVMGIDKAWVTLTEDDAKAHFMEFKTGAAWVGGGESNCVLGGSEEYTSESPVELYETKELTSIKFPAEATELVSLDSTNLETVDLSECEAGSPIIEQVKETVGDDVEVIVPSEPLPFELVDLGLPSGTKWASCNLGATKPEEYGDYYMWGSVTPNTDDVCDWAHAPYQTNASPTSSSTTKWTKYLGSTSSSYKDPSATDEDALKTVLDPEVDAAYVATNGKAHMPTKAQFNELLSGTTNEWTTENGVYGRRFTSKTDSSKYIFIPASGGRFDSSFVNQGSSGYVWSSSLDSNNPYSAWGLYFGSGNCNMGGFNRYSGFTVRPVSE